MGGLFGSQDVTTTTKTELSPYQKELLTVAMPHFRQFASDGVTLPEGTGIAPMNPLQQKSQKMALQGAEDQSQLAGGAGNYSNWLFSGGALDPSSNPGLKGAIGAATRPIFEGLERNILPQIRSGAATTGNYGSTRQGIAEGLAAQGATSAAGDAASNLAFKGYEAGLDATSKGMALLPQTMQALQMPAQSVGIVGDIRQSFDQTMLDAVRQRYLQEQLLPVQVGQELLGAVGAIPTAGSTATTSGYRTNPLSAILGLGSMLLGGPAGGGLGSAFAFL